MDPYSCCHEDKDNSNDDNADTNTASTITDPMLINNNARLILETTIDKITCNERSKPSRPQADWQFCYNHTTINL